MGDQPQQGQPPSGYGDEIPRRGYTRRQTGDYNRVPNPNPEGGRSNPPPPPKTPPPVYGSNPPPPPAPQQQYAPRPGSPPPPVRGRRGERAPRDSGLYLPWWSLLILVLAVGAAALGILLLVMNLSSAGLASQPPQFIIVTNPASAANGANNVPSAGDNQPPPNSVPTLAATSAPELPTLIPSRTPPPLAGGCQLNAEVVVVGTGAVGLSLRETPRTSGERLWVAQEGDRLQIVDGPQNFDDYEWCKVNNLTRPGQSGWAVTNFMVPAEDVE